MERTKNKLKDLREEFKLSVRAEAELIKIHFTLINRLEIGKQRLSTEYIQTFTDFFQVTSDYLLGLSNTGIKCETLDERKLVVNQDEYNKYKGHFFINKKQQRKITRKGYSLIVSDRNESVVEKTEQVISPADSKEIEKLNDVISFWQNASKNKDNNIKLLELKNEALQTNNELLLKSKLQLIQEVRKLEQERDELEGSIRVFSRMITNKE